MNEILIKLGIGTLGAAIGFLLYQFFGKGKPSAGSNELLKARVEILDKEKDNILQTIKTSESESSEKVKVIENEQNKDVDNQSIVDFLNNRKP